MAIVLHPSHCMRYGTPPLLWLVLSVMFNPVISCNFSYQFCQYVDALYEFGDPQDRSFYAPGAVSDASSASPLRYMVNRLLLHGATVAKHLHVGVTHIIVNDLSDCNRIAIIKVSLLLYYAFVNSNQTHNSRLDCVNCG